MKKLFIAVFFSLLVLSMGLTNISKAESMIPEITESNNVGSDVSVVYTRNSIVPVYDHTGKVIKNFSVAPNTSWYTDRIITFDHDMNIHDPEHGHESFDNNHIEEFYRISSDGYVNSKDIDIVSPNGSLISISGSNVYLVSKDGTALEEQLAPGSWKIGNVIQQLDVNGNPRINRRGRYIQNLIQVSSNGYIEPDSLNGIEIINK